MTESPSSQGCRASVIIPAHNEESVIQRTLQTLTSELREGEFEIFVICNGCEDRTAEISREFAPLVSVDEVDEASKIVALNRGDTLARAFPRIYLDADILLSSDSLRKVASALESPGALAAEPLPRMDLSGCTWLVRRWYQVWLGLHGGIPGKIGCGLFALSRLGRERFEEFPDIIADDLYARSHFDGEELKAVAGAETVVKVPRSIGDLIRIKTRSRLGSYQLAQRYPELEAKRNQGRKPSRRPWQLPIQLWLWIPLYVMVTRSIRRRAQGQSQNLADYQWERDLSSRQND